MISLASSVSLKDDIIDFLSNFEVGLCQTYPYQIEVFKPFKKPSETRIMVSSSAHLHFTENKTISSLKFLSNIVFDMQRPLINGFDFYTVDIDYM